MSRTDGPNPSGGMDKNPGFLLHKEGYKIEDYRLITRIGEGSFGEVWKAERGGLPVALKILKTSMTSDETQRELKSLETLKQLHHKFLLRTDNFWSDGDRLFIEMELAEGGTLKERLKAYQALGKPGIPEEEVLKYFTEMAKALDYLHGHRPVFLHRDIKPANILLVQGCAKLADFGLLRQVAGDNSSTKTQGGTFPYMAPESVASDVFSIYTDLFSFAVTYAELRQGELPFSGKNQYQICEKILRKPPELTDIFHPEERKVLLKALDKDPRQRFSSCGEFVFELNRVVPWVPAVEVPVLASPPPAANTRGTDIPPPKVAEVGTTRKPIVPTMPDIALPEPSASVGTASRHDGAADTDKKRLGSAGTYTPEHKSTATALPVSARPKTPPRTLLVIGLAAAAVIGVVGIWFLGSQSVKGEVHDLLAKNKFPEALAALKDANRLFLPNPAPLQKEVEEKWWAELPEPRVDDRDALKKSLRELDKFKEAFPQHEAVKARRAKIVAGLIDLVGADVDRSLAAKKIDEAGELLAEYKDALPDAGRAFQGRIDDKQEVLAVLKNSAEKLKSKDFDGCLDSLKASKAPFEHKDDLDARTKLLDSAKAGATARDETHRKLVSALDDALKAKKTAEVQAKLEELRTFRKQFAKTDWQPDLRKYQLSTNWSGRFAEAWKPLLADKIVLDDCRRALKEAKDQLGQTTLDPAQEKNLLALEALIKAHESSKAAVGELVALLRNADPDLSRNLWLGLALLDRNKESLRFDDLDALPAAPDDELAKKASSDLFAHVLERLVKKDGYAWFPGKAEFGKGAIWCEQRIGSDDDLLRTFHTECLIESGAALPAINQIALPGKGDWYVAYVRSLVLDKNKKHGEAADVLLGIWKENAAVHFHERSKNAVRVLRSAVAALPHAGAEGKQFAAAKDAVRAGPWLMAVCALAPQPTADDIAGLAFAAVQGDAKDAGKMLDRAEQSMNTKAAAADRPMAASWIGKAYRLDLERAGTGLARPTWDQSVEKCGRAQKFASQWKNSTSKTRPDMEPPGRAP